MMPPHERPRRARHWRRLGTGLSTIFVLLGLLRESVPAVEFEVDAPPFNYHVGPTRDPIAELQRRLDRGDAELEYHGTRGYLDSLLEVLDVSSSSQLLVFSKTSLQQAHISPRRPRALYYSEDVYVGWVQGGDRLEISAVDPERGAVFYTLVQSPVTAPRFERDRGSCLQCHHSRRTRGVPGHLVRSVYPLASGLPLFRAGTIDVTYATPIEERWGGWYVTGKNVPPRHMGNRVLRDASTPESILAAQHKNDVDLATLFDTTPYVTSHSDLVALLVHDHQTSLHNAIAAASYQVRLALYQQETLNRLDGRDSEYLGSSARRRIAQAGGRLLRELLLLEQAPLPVPMRGSTGFADEFVARGTKDRLGRSLRQLDLTTRLFKYPCSYLIYSDAFDALPTPLLDWIYTELLKVLTGETNARGVSASIPPAEREAVLAILVDTKIGLPDDWPLPRASKARF